MTTKSRLPAIPMPPPKLIIVMITVAILIALIILAIRLGVIGSDVEATITDPVQYVESIKSGELVAAVASTSASSPDLTKPVETASENNEIHGIAETTTGLLEGIGSAIPEYIATQQNLSTKVDNAEASIVDFNKSLDFYHSKLEFIQNEQNSTATNHGVAIKDLSIEIRKIKSLVTALENRISGGSKASKPVATNSKLIPKVVPPFKLLQIAKWNGDSIATVTHQGQSTILKTNHVLAGWIAKGITTHCLLLTEGKHEANLCIE